MNVFLFDGGFMKKIFKTGLFALLLFIISLCLYGCSGVSEDTVKALEDKIIALEDALAIDEIELEELQSELDSVKKTDKNGNSRADANYDEVNKSLDNIRKELTNIQEASGRNIKVCLADKYYLVVGNNFQLFYRSVIQAVYPYGYYIRVSGDDGHTLNRYYEFKPEKEGTYNLKIEVCDDNGFVLGSDETKLIVSSDKTTESKVILCIGDSLTASGDWVTKSVSMFKKAGGEVSTIGTISATKNSVTCKYEGRSGWSWSNYLNKYDTVDSPFKNGDSISFTNYVSKNKFAAPTEFYIMMTFNGLPGVFQEFSFDQDFIKNAKKLIDQIHYDYPNAKINLMGLPLTSQNGGLGAYYSISLGYSDNYGKGVTVFNYDNFLEDWCKMDEYKDFMRYIDIKGQFDSEYNMPSESKPVNNTSSKTELVGNAMGLHPSVDGYNQIGEAVFRAMMASWGK